METGTIMVKDINSGLGNSGPSFLINVNGTLFFGADDGVHGFELWKSDGTEAGTVMVKDINPGTESSFPSIFPNVNSILFFWANDGTHGDELWRSDGTETGTIMIKDINPSLGTVGLSGVLSSIANVNGTLFFGDNDGAHGDELWKSDGTEARTVMVKDINPGSGSSAAFPLSNVNGVLFFWASDGVHGRELWKSGGTGAGTVMVKDINPGPENGT